MIESHPVFLMNKFIYGDHVIYLQKRLWDGIWSDIAIEATYMKTGKGPYGIIGMCLPFSKTKENLIDIVSNDLLVRLSQDPPNMKIVITSKHNVPDEVSN